MIKQFAQKDLPENEWYYLSPKNSKNQCKNGQI